MTTPRKTAPKKGAGRSKPAKPAKIAKPVTARRLEKKKAAPAKAAAKATAKATPKVAAKVVKTAPPAKVARPTPKPATKAPVAKVAPKATGKAIAAAPKKKVNASGKPVAEAAGKAAAKPAAAPKLKVLEMIRQKKAGVAPNKDAASPSPSATAKPTPAKPAAKPAAKAAAAPLDKKAMLAKLLAMRADDTRERGKKAARDVREHGGLNNLHPAPAPTSVHKAAEFAETRKISAIVKKRTQAKPAATEPAAGPSEAELAERRARRRKSPYSKNELRELREILESERARLLRDLAVINDVATSSEEDMSRSFSSHQADAARDTAALETTFMTRRYEEERLSMVSRALERLEEGTYGLCEQCADDPQNLCESCPFIPIGRLRAKPFAAMCLPLRQDYEKRNKR